MRTAGECEKCLEGLAGRLAGEAAGPQGDPGPLKEAATDVLARRFTPGGTVATRMATRMFRAVVEASGNRDPFLSVKKREYAAGLVAARRAARYFGEELGGLLALSLEGNRLDFFRDLAEVEEEWRSLDARQVGDDREEFLRELKEGVSLLMLADNAGELPFDRPLLEKLKSLGVKVTYGVKGRPCQNDLTREDVACFGPPPVRIVDTGTDWIGCEWAMAGEELKNAWAGADLVLAKGMANLETITEYPDLLASKRIFFGLVVKCPPVSRLVKIPLGSAVLLDSSRLL